MRDLFDCPFFFSNLRFMIQFGGKMIEEKNARLPPLSDFARPTFTSFENACVILLPVCFCKMFCMMKMGGEEP